MQPDAVQLHPPHEAYPERKNNILWEGHLRKGDIEQGFQEADVIVEQDYYTPFQEHGYEELECSIGVPEGDGVVVYCGSQGPTFDQEQIAATLGLSVENVRVAHMPTGGAFGGREDVNTQVHAGLAAYLLKRPVKVRFSRYESLRAHHKRHAQFMQYKAGVMKDGRVVALEAILHGDTGAYASTGEAVMFRSMTFAGGPYEIPHVKVDSYAVHTNNVTCGAFRGFGNPQPTFASGLHMEKMARAIGMDSFEFRLKNALRVGRATHTGQVITEDVGDGIAQCLEAVRRAVKKTQLPETGPDEKVGIGVAGCYKNVGLGGGIPDSAGAQVSLQEDGSFLLRMGAADMGQGSAEAMLNITAETLGIDRGDIFLHIADTHQDPHGGMSTASRQTFVSGNATLKASEDLLKQIQETVASEFQVDAEQVALQEGDIIRSDTGKKLLSLKEFAEHYEGVLVGIGQYDTPPTRPVPEWARPAPSQEDIDNNRLHFAYSFGAQATIVTVNEKTGAFKIHRVIAAFDAGRAINRPGVEGQIEGGVIQGMGYATSEHFHLEQGQPSVTTHAQIGLPKTSELPEIEAIIIEEPHPYGPMGAKGMGEMPLSAAAPSIVNAIHDAVGIWIHELPVTQEKVLQALKLNEGSK
jgi:CO/xanthine dehydrogenase Mo-binding subunit